MAYCENCGKKHKAPKNYYSQCGTAFQQSAVATTSYQSSVNFNTGGLSGQIAAGIERADAARRHRKNNVNGSNESLEMYLKFVGFIAIIHGISYMAGPSAMTLLNGYLGVLLIIGVIAGAFFKVIFDVRLGYAMARSLIEVLLVGIVAYGLIFGIFWYLTENYMHSGKPLLEFKSIVGRTPIVKR